MGRRMRDLMAQKTFLFPLGIGTPLHAKIVEKVGFDYVYMGGNDTSLTLLGLPDVGLITETEMVNNARNIAKAVNVPGRVSGDRRR